jgi:dTMP kinase
MSDRLKGRFISFEGGEGVGKSTQVRAVAHKLRALGHSVVVTREPGGSSGAEAIRTLLLDRQLDAWSPASEALLFAAARSDHVERIIQPALARGDVVLCDRYVDSTRAYQGENGGGTLPDSDILALHHIGSGGLMPDRTILLTADAHTAEERRDARDGIHGDRFEMRSAGFHAAVAARFLEIASEEPSRFRVISSDQCAADVAAAIMDALADLL